ncbi:hemogen [Phalacrocorax carbo]|uniref:hemogen n=1 Tax=Phalacrocorax carbo TaxID=9209 RepID=UPI0031191CFE
MESSGKGYAYSDSSLPPSAAREEHAVPDVIITHRLRDRELLRKRKAKAEEKQSTQWVLKEQKNKRQRTSRGARRGRGHLPAVEPILEPELELDHQLGPQEEAEPVPSKSASPEPVHQEQLPVLTIQDLVSGMQQGAVEGELAARSQDPTGEDEVLKPAEEIPEALNTTLENDHQDNKESTYVLF